QDIVVNILTALKNFISQHNIGKILSDVDVYIDEENVYRPDIMFIANDQMDILGEDGYIHGVPALIIEVLSKGTKRYDKGEKKEVYEKHGVKEYWLIDTDTLQCKGFINENNKFKEIETTNKNFVIHLFELKIELEQ